AFDDIDLLEAPGCPEIYTLSLHDALPIWRRTPRAGRTSTTARRTASWAASCASFRPRAPRRVRCSTRAATATATRTTCSSGSGRSEEHTSELQSPYDLVCRLLLEKKNMIS